MTDVVRGLVRRGVYADSVSLLQITSAVAALDGVLDAALVMATDLNRDALDSSGMLFDQAATAGANDLLVVVRAASSVAAEAALEAAVRLLAERRQPGHSASDGGQPPRSVRSAHRARPDANLAVISVPGAFAAAEARQALAEGLHVFLFSDNVSIQEELELKQLGRDLGLLVMGPDCGTAIINGVGLGFANAVRRGRIGLIGASGTGLQEVTTLLHRAGQGVSHAIGTGGRDLDERVGAITTLQALELLREDATTDVIVLISKPPAAAVATRVLSAAASVGKPVVACLLGAALEPPPGVKMASNLYQAARLAAGVGAAWDSLAAEDLPRVRHQPGQRRLRALYCGGTLCHEAELAIGGDGEHEFIDFGDDRYTRNRAHPMIDPSLRNQAILAAADDPRVAVLLLDVILGYGAHHDPAGVLAAVLREAQARALGNGRQLTLLAHVLGTDQDPQDLARSEQALRSVGVHLFGSNHHAAVAAGLVLEAAAI
ncbi:MAG: acyl-CoA synthetase FdrA [Chloroflexota bacterium]|nr:acyl-CoA synthetase FdrA [Chloroflexota bacterium]